MKIPNKIGFHTGPGGNPTGIGDWMRALDRARIPFTIKSVDSYGPIFEASQIAKQSGVDHVLIYRISTRGQGGRYDYDVPPYKDPKFVNDPEGGAEKHWRETLAKIPPEFDKARTWIEPINEVDKDLCDWLGRFAVHIANLAQRDGYKVSLFAWSSGEPEPAGWEEPGMLEYLRLCAQRPNQAAVALHEYSYVVDDIMHEFPFKIGRFQQLFAVCDKHGIARPTVHITEWGWTLDNVPVPEKAIPDIRKVGQLYARYPEIKGAAIWYLGPSFGGIANKAQKLIKPVTEFTLAHQFKVDKFDEPRPPEPTIGEPPERPRPDPATPPRHDEREEDTAVRPAPPPVPIVPPLDSTPAPPPIPEPEPQPEPQPPALPDAVFVADVTIPDDSEIVMGESFTKVWRVKNTGDVAWDSGFSLVHTDGSAMGVADRQRPLPITPPGETAEISIRFRAPRQPGSHFSDWRFQDPSGQLFGEIVYVRITAVVGQSNSAFLADVSVPDDTKLLPGQVVTKTWRIKNNGNRSWGPEFTLNFIDGVAMSDELVHPLPIVEPGEAVEISLELTVPSEVGTYFTDWQMHDELGKPFGDIYYMRVVVRE